MCLQCENLLEQQIGRNRILAVLTIENADHAVPTARALLDGGVGAVEPALRTNASLESLSRITEEVPEKLVGVGTVVRPDQCHEVARRGGAFALAPAELIAREDWSAISRNAEAASKIAARTEG